MNNTPPDAILFDLDDTLIDWWGSIQACLSTFAPNEVTVLLQNYCSTHLWHRNEQHGYVEQRDTWKLHEFRHEEWQRALPDLHPDERHAHVSTFSQRLSVAFFPDIVPTLNALKNNHRIAVLSNNPHLEREKNRLGLDEWFELCMSAAHTTPKPHPNAFLDACAQLKVAPEKTWYVGDSIRADARGALAAGLTPIWVDRWNDNWHDRPNEVVRVPNVSAIAELLA